MRKIMITGFTVVLCLIFLAYPTPAEEGMWLLSQLKDLGLDKKGIEIPVSKIYDPGNPSLVQATIDLGGGSAEFVSPDGLILTNHHVAFGAVQRASTGGTDYISNGFLARTLEEEMEGPGYTARVLQSMTDITAKFKKFLKIKDPVKREKAIKSLIKKIEEKEEKAGSDISADVESMFNGKQYFLFVYKRFDDVRVVYVPPKAIGNYGGNIDNWMWPRHTGDFSFMRVYVAPDGTGRKYHKDNVPYKPKHWFKIGVDGLKKGDQTFILGYPGRTTRYRTSAAVKHMLEYQYPSRIKLFDEIIKLNESFHKDSKIAMLKTAGIIKGLNNAMKNYQGNVEGMNRTNFLQHKIDFEKELMAFLKKDENLFKKYGSVLDNIKALYAEKTKTRELDDMLSLALRRLSGAPASTAMWVYNTAKEREKPKKLRDPSFSESDNKRRLRRFQYTFMSYFEPAHKAMLVKTLTMADQLPEGNRIKGFEYILKDKSKTIEQWVDDMFAKTKFKDFKYMESVAYKNVKQLEALGDPFIELAKQVYADRESYRERNRVWDSKIEELRRQYIEALLAWKGKGLYPDANGTIRFSLGRVKGYKPRDAVYYTPFTTLTGVLEKDTGQPPFDVPESLKKLAKARDFGRWVQPELNDVPVAFTHMVDSTGGNSGSPVLNGKGELVGILFDGNYESMTADWEFDPAITRSISVDIRYVMFVTEKVAGANYLLKEMGIK